METHENSTQDLATLGTIIKMKVSSTYSFIFVFLFMFLF